MTATTVRPLSRVFAPSRVLTRSANIEASDDASLRYVRLNVASGDCAEVAADAVRAASIRPFRLIAQIAATFLLVAGGMLLAVSTAPRLFGYGTVTVTSGSMEPLISPGDSVVVRAPGAGPLAIDTVINIDHGDRTVLHRIVGHDDRGYVTGGDANAVPDSVVAAPDMVLGVAILKIPLAGYPGYWASRGQWLHLAGLAAVAAALASMSRASFVTGPTASKAVAA